MFTNPIIPGFHPDPSICRHGEDYYLVTSSFGYFPGIPLFHSRDLVHWRQIGHCLDRPTQLPLECASVEYGGIYAPTIRHHNGRFYVITSNVTAHQNIVVWTDDITGPWSEPVVVGPRGGDPSLMFDNDGTVYFTGNGAGGIVQCRIDITTGAPLDDLRAIWPGSGGQYPEGPHLYHIGDWYYLLISEGGTEYGHMMTAARSRHPFGPFEPCPHNPILTHRSIASPLQGLGHADLIQAHDSSWWAVFLGYRPVPYPPAYTLGRETNLAPVTWTADGWPMIGDNGRVSVHMDSPSLTPHPWPLPEPRDDFNEPHLRPCWNFIRNPAPNTVSLSVRAGWLALRGVAGAFDNRKLSPAWVGRRFQHLSCMATTCIDFQEPAPGEEAGLMVWANERHHYEIAIAGSADGGRHIILRQQIGPHLKGITAQAPLGPGLVQVRVEAQPYHYRFSYCVANGAFIALGSADTRYVSTECAGGFTGTYAAVYASCEPPQSASTHNAFFDWFDYREMDRRD